MATTDLNIRITAELADIKSALRGLQTDITKVSGAAERAGEKASKGFSGFESVVGKAQKALAGFASIYTAISAVRGLTALSDQYAQINGVLTLATGSSEEFAKAQKGVYEIAQETRAPLAETANVYSAIERNTRSLGLTQDDLLQAVETVNKAIATTPVSAQAAQAALVQFGQALGGNFTAGAQELNSILEQAPGLAHAIAQGLGVATSDLKKMGEAGELSTELVIRGLLRISDQVEEKFVKVPRTVSGAIQQLKNDLVVSLGQTDMTPLIQSFDQLREVLTDPTVQQGLANIAAILTRIASVSVKAAGGIGQTFGRLGEIIGRDMALLTGQVTQLDYLEDQIKDVDAALSSSLLGKPGKFLFTSREQLEVLRDQLLAEKAAIEAAQGIGDGKVEGLAEREMQRLAVMVGELNVQIDRLKNAGDITRFLLGGQDGVDEAIGNYERQRDAIASLMNAKKADADAEKAEAARRARQTEEEKKRAAAAAEAAFKAAQAATARKAAEEEARKEAERRQKQVKETIASIEEEAATFGKTADEVIRYRLALLGATEAQIQQGMTAARTLERLKLMKEALDELAKADREAAEERKRAGEQLADSLADLRAKELELSGNDAGAVDARLEERRRKIVEQMRLAGDESGIEFVDRVFNLERAQGRLDALKRKAAEAVQAMQAAEQTSAARVDAGADPAVASAEQRAAREEALAILREVRLELQGLPVDTMGANQALLELDQTLGGIAARNLPGFEQAIAGLRAQLRQMREDFAGDSLGALRDSLSGLFTDLAEGSKTAKEALKDFVRDFATSMAQIASRAAATFLILQTLDLIYPGLGKATAATMNAGVLHAGGMAGTGPRRKLPAMMFAAAPRYHAGGMAGLKPGELPAVLQRGEEVLAKNDPRNAANGGGDSRGVRIVNAMDPRFVPDQMDSAAGEEVILNVIGRNPGRVMQLLR